MSQNESEWASLEATISGMVQGVGYRFYAQRRAQGLHVTGYVMNLPDGRVKVVGEGTRQALVLLLGELKNGPSLSWVEEVQAIWGDYRGRFRDFSLRFHE